MSEQLTEDFVTAYADWLGVTYDEAYRLLEAEPLVDVTEELTAAGWDESQHPRHPAGSEKGGEFAPKEGAVYPFSPKHEGEALERAKAEADDFVAELAAKDHDAKVVAAFADGGTSSHEVDVIGERRLLRPTEYYTNNRYTLAGGIPTIANRHNDSAAAAEAAERIEQQLAKLPAEDWEGLKRFDVGAADALSFMGTATYVPDQDEIWLGTQRFAEKPGILAHELGHRVQLKQTDLFREFRQAGLGAHLPRVMPDGWEAEFGKQYAKGERRDAEAFAESYMLHYLEPETLKSRAPEVAAFWENRALRAAAWDEAAHPRHPAGTEQGGEFAPKLSSAKGLTKPQYEALKGYREGLLRASSMGFQDQTHLSGHFMNKILRGQMSDEEAAQELYENTWHNPMNPSAPVYKKEWPRAVANVATTRKHIKLLDQAIKNSVLDEDTVVYRGMTYPGDAITPRDPNRRIKLRDDPDSFVGKKFTDRGFTATTYVEDIARKGFAKSMWDAGWVMRFTVPKGTPALAVKENGIKSGLKINFPDSEGEILLGRGHSFVVKAVDWRSRTMDLEMAK